MLRLILLLRRLCPRATRLRAWEERVWRSIWEKKEREEQQKVPAAAPDSPISGSERAVLIETLARLWPFGSLLEVGCGYAQNAGILLDLFPSLRYVGVDSDPERVLATQQFLNSQRRQNAIVIEGDAANLEGFPDNSAELVLSSAFLLYVAPEQLQTVLREMARVARRSIVLLEQHDPAASAAGRQVSVAERPPYWLRDYREALLEALPEFAVRVIDVPNPRWTIEDWRSYAAVILAEKQQQAKK